jgi:hypothetical protein
VATRLAAFAAREYRGWDGIFLDELWGQVPPWALRKLPGSRAREWPRIRAEWDAYRDRFVAEMRARYDGLLIANVGRRPERVRHLDLDGISIEHEFVTSAEESLRFVHEFRRYPATRCIAWDWNVDPDVALTGRTRRHSEPVPDPSGSEP